MDCFAEHREISHKSIPSRRLVKTLFLSQVYEECAGLHSPSEKSGKDGLLGFFVIDDIRLTCCVVIHDKSVDLERHLCVEVLELLVKPWYRTVALGTRPTPAVSTAFVSFAALHSKYNTRDMAPNPAKSMTS